MNNDTGGDHPMPGTRMRRLFDENLSMIETMTRIEIRRLGRMPRGTHLGQDDGNPVTDLLPDPAADEATLASNPATGSGDMRFDHWFEDQYWADETDGGE